MCLSSFFFVLIKLEIFGNQIRLWAPHSFLFISCLRIHSSSLLAPQWSLQDTTWEDYFETQSNQRKQALLSYWHHLIFTLSYFSYLDILALYRLKTFQKVFKFKLFYFIHFINWCFNLNLITLLFHSLPFDNMQGYFLWFLEQAQNRKLFCPKQTRDSQLWGVSTQPACTRRNPSPRSPVNILL